LWGGGFFATQSTVKIMQCRLYTHKGARTIGGMKRTVENGRSRRKHSPSTTLSATNPTQIGLGVFVIVFIQPPTKCLHCEALSTDINALILLRIIYF